MNRYILITLLSFLSLSSFAQFSIGAEGGTAIAIAKNNAHIEQQGVLGQFKNTFSLSFLTTTKHTVNFGFFVYVESYALNYNTDNIGIRTTNELQANINSTYTFIAPTADIRLDKKSRWHLLVMPGLGFLNSTNISCGYSYINAATNTLQSVSVDNSNASKIIFRFGAQIQRHIRLFKENYLILALGYSVQAGSLLTNVKEPLDAAQPNIKSSIHPGVFSFQIGYLHNFKKVKFKLLS